MMSNVSRSRHGARVVLHEIARPYFKYPPLEDSWWYLPEVIRWQAWEPVTAPPRGSRGLVGKLIVPALVNFFIPPHVYVKHANSFTEFKLHLQQRTGSTWKVDDDTLAEHYIRAERLDAVVYITEPGSTTTHRLALPKSTRPRRSLVGSLVRGVFQDEYSRKDLDYDGTAGHSAGDGEERL